MDTYAVHLAMAALVGASFVAVSAYYMHRKTLNQLLEFTKAMERERERERGRRRRGRARGIAAAFQEVRQQTARPWPEKGDW
ncbi:AMP deaminase [Sarracenia purpurea var. burkii]